MNLTDLLDKLVSVAANTRQQGDAFERMMLAYLRTDPIFAERFEKVYALRDWPDRPEDMIDDGIDLVGIETDGGVCAIQCKFIRPNTEVSKPDIDSFLAASSRRYFASRLIIATTDRWGKNATAVLNNQDPPAQRLGLSDLFDAPIDWSVFDPNRPSALTRTPRRELREHQRDAIRDVNRGFVSSDQGKLIMACGTGKTFTSLRLAEEMVGRGGHVLFLVPSIALLSQAFREWSRESRVPIQALAVCSDRDANKVDRNSEDQSVIDLLLPATTKPERLASHLETARLRAQLADFGEPMYVTFSTYQSLEIVERAQLDFNFPKFDLILCDEAHRTAGIGGMKEDSSFVLVHDHQRIIAAKRLYMTATPKVYGDRAKSKARDDDVVLYSMDNEAYFGPEFHRLGFGEAVDRGLLSDYRVIILAVDEAYAAQSMHEVYADADNTLTLNDAAKLLGCWMGLAKISDHEEEFANDPDPMKTGVIFVNKIVDSKQIQQTFRAVVDQANAEGIGEQKRLPQVSIRHIDGSMGALERNEDLNWLRERSPDLRVLTNAKCLSEGVDVPSLDAIMFLQPRKSQVDVVQAVGRVMRKAEGKKFGYVILPVVVQSNADPDEALDNNKDFEVVWQILQALKAHDERFEAIVNTLSYGKSKDPKIDVIGITGKSQDRETTFQESVETDLIQQFSLWPSKIEDAIYARISKRTSSVRYWPQWADDVAALAARYVSRIRAATARNPAFKSKLEELVQSLQDNINPSLTEDDAVEMLSQHMVTRPVFDALFEGDAFVQSNPVSQALELVVRHLRVEEDTDREAESLDRFYESVRGRASAADTREKRQRLVKDLYENFFNTALKRTTDRMGIAYTPIEIVDFILRSVNELAKQYFDVSLSDQGVHILDPFAGTGTFLVRLIELGLLDSRLDEKYRLELHANEILLLAYYIAAINIESAYHMGKEDGDYVPFDGIVLTDTFQLNESHEHMGERVFEANSARIQRQRNAPITVIVGNPPYSVGQQDANDNAKNLAYPILDSRITSTYAANSSAGLKKSLYDSYIRAIRWATDRIGDSGIVCFVTNGGWLRGASGDGLRASLEQEFDAVYVFDLRGNQRTGGEQSVKEGGKVFGQASRVPVTIVALVRGAANEGASKGIFYHDIGDYLSREEKLNRLTSAGSMNAVEWTTIVPHAQHDWIDQRDESWTSLVPLAGDGAVFKIDSNGLVTSRDAWTYNSSRFKLTENIERTISCFNQELDRYRQQHPVNLDRFVRNDATQISWSDGLKKALTRLGRSPASSLTIDESSLRVGLYRPFFNQWCYFDQTLNERSNQLPRLFPTSSTRNPTIITSGRGAGKFSVLATDVTPNFHALDTSHVFARYRFESKNGGRSAALTSGALFEIGVSDEGSGRIDNITDLAMEQFQTAVNDASLTKDDLFAYVYGVLNHPGYQSKYQNNLTREYPRIPWLEGYRELINIGSELLALHLGYEEATPFPLEEEFGIVSSQDVHERYRATAMQHVRKRSGARGKADWDRTKIKVNEHLILSGIPEEASQWMLGPRPALELFLQRMRPSTDKDSRIINNPNEFSEDPRYVVELTKRVITVCVKTLQCQQELTALGFEEIAI